MNSTNTVQKFIFIHGGGNIFHKIQINKNKNKRPINKNNFTSTRRRKEDLGVKAKVCLQDPPNQHVCQHILLLFLGAIILNDRLET